MILLNVQLEPVAASRPRVGKYGTFYHKTYNVFRREIKEALTQAWAGQDLIDGPVFMYVDFCLERPQSPSADYPLRGDGDNFEKALYDGMNDTVWTDDKHLIGAEWTKRWAPPGEPGSIQLAIVEVDPKALSEEWVRFWKESANSE